MRIFRDRKPLPEKVEKPLEGGIGYLTVNLLDGQHDLLSSSVNFMIKQEARHSEWLNTYEARANLDARVLDVDNIFNHELYTRLIKEYGEDNIIRENIILEEMGTVGWAEAGVEDYTYFLEMWARGRLSNGKAVRMEGHAMIQQWDIPLIRFSKVFVDEKEMACTFCLLYGTQLTSSLAYGKFNIVQSETVTKQHFTVCDAFISRLKAVKRNLPAHIEKKPYDKYVYTKVCLPFTITLNTIPNEEVKNGTYNLIQLGRYSLDKVGKVI